MGNTRLVSTILICILVSVLMVSGGGSNEEEITQASEPSESNNIDFEEEEAIETVECDWELQFQPDIRIVDIEAIDASHVWALGNDSDSVEKSDEVTSCFYFYDGISWSEISRIKDHLYKLFIYDERNIWATGYTGGWHCVIYFYDGSTLSKQYEFIGEYENSILDMAIMDEDHVWVLCSGLCCCGEGLIYFFDGVSWTEQLHVEILAAMEVLSTTNAWAAGTGGFYAYDGQSWSNRIPSDRIFDLCVTDMCNLWATDLDYLFFSDGNSVAGQFETRWLDGSFVTRPVEDWEAREGDRLTSGPYPIWAADSSHIWAHVESGYAENALIFFDGSSWMEHCMLRPNEVIQGFSFIDPDNVWMIGVTGEDRSILYYDGINWIRIMELEEKTYDVCPINNEYVLVASESGVFLSRMVLAR